MKTSLFEVDRDTVKAAAEAAIAKILEQRKDIYESEVHRLTSGLFGRSRREAEEYMAGADYRRCCLDKRKPWLTHNSLGMEHATLLLKACSVASKSVYLCPRDAAFVADNKVTVAVTFSVNGRRVCMEKRPVTHRELAGLAGISASYDKHLCILRVRKDPSKPTTAVAHNMPVSPSNGDDFKVGWDLPYPPKNP